MWRWLFLPLSLCTMCISVCHADAGFTFHALLCFNRAGYAGEEAPISIVPSCLKEVFTEKWLRDITDETELRAVLRTFLRHVYLR